MIEQLASLVNENPAVVRRGRNLSAEFMIEIGDVAHHVVIDRGRIAHVESGPFIMRHWSFAIRATESAWAKFWQPFPEPGFQDIFAMNRFGHCRIEGDVDLLLANLRYVKDVLAAPRGKPVAASTGGRGDG